MSEALSLKDREGESEEKRKRDKQTNRKTERARLEIQKEMGGILGYIYRKRV